MISDIFCVFMGKIMLNIAQKGDANGNQGNTGVCQKDEP